jgi:hypothetical protein
MKNTHNQKKVSAGGEEQKKQREVFKFEGEMNGSTENLKKFIDVLHETDITNDEEMRKAIERAGLKGKIVQRNKHTQPSATFGGKNGDLADKLKEAIEEKTKELSAKKENKFFSIKMRSPFFLAILVTFIVLQLSHAYQFSVAGNFDASTEAISSATWILLVAVIDSAFNAYIALTKLRLSVMKKRGLDLVGTLKASILEAQREFEKYERLTDQQANLQKAIISTERAQKAILQSERDKAVRELEALKAIAQKVDAFNKTKPAQKKAKTVAKK